MNINILRSNFRNQVVQRFVRYNSKHAPETSDPSRANPRGRTIDSQKGVLEFIDPNTGAGATRTGRSWRTSELRLKSYEDLHKLWFILLKERNILLTERAWCKTNSRHWTNGQSNLYKVKRSMARIKSVVGERIRAYRAKKLAETMKAEIEGRNITDVTSPSPSDNAGVISRGL